MSNPSNHPTPYPEHDSVSQNSAPIVHQQIIITPIIVQHILIQQVGVPKTKPLFPNASQIKTTHKKDVEEKSIRKDRNDTKVLPQNHKPKDYEVTVHRVVRKQNNATHSNFRPDDHEMVIMGRETFENLVRAKHHGSIHSGQVAGNKQKVKTYELVEQLPKPKPHHEARPKVKPLESALRVRQPEGDHSEQQETVLVIERHVKFQSPELGTVRR